LSLLITKYLAHTNGAKAACGTGLHAALAHSDRHVEPSAPLLRPHSTVAIEAAAARLEPADVLGRAGRAAIVTAQALTAVSAPLARITDVITWPELRFRLM